MPHPPARGRSGKRRERPPQGRRKPPPDETGEERSFLVGLLKAGRRLAIDLTDGSRIVGTVRSFNENTIVFETDDRSELVLRKSQIRTLEELD